MLDLAREQCPSQDNLFTYARMAQDAGYDALGLYLEHRFAFKCAPWANGKHAVTADHVKALESEFPSLEIIPFINLLGHMEGFIYTEEGRSLREETFNGLQACPSCPELVQLAEQIVDETLQVFKSDLVHIGGDETRQLNFCPICQARTAEEVKKNPDLDPKAFLYGNFFAPLLQRILDQNRTPAVWGDMFPEHPQALEIIPKETVIFDWQYFQGVKDTAPLFKDFRVYGSPALHVYNAPWLHVEATEKNVREVSQDCHDLGLEGVCVTLWEGALFGAFDSFFPALEWCVRAIDNPKTDETILSVSESHSDNHRAWADLMGVQLEQIGGVFGFKQLRNPLKARLLLYSNPFLCWMHHHKQLAGPDGEKALQICEQALHVAPDEASRNATVFVRSAVEFVRLAEEARKLYAQEQPDAAIVKLATLRHLFESLEKTARQNYERIGGSLADVARCQAALKHVETVVQRIRNYGRRELGYLPAFDVITNARFMPHDQGCWWLVNKWANE